MKSMSVKLVVIALQSVNYPPPVSEGQSLTAAPSGFSVPDILSRWPTVSDKSYSTAGAYVKSTNTSGARRHHTHSAEPRLCRALRRTHDDRSELRVMSYEVHRAGI